MKPTSWALAVLVCAACSDDEPILSQSTGTGAGTGGSGGVFTASVSVGNGTSSSTGGQGGAGGEGGGAAGSGGCATCSEVLEGTADKDSLCESSLPLAQAIGVCVCDAAGQCVTECALNCSGMGEDPACVPCAEENCSDEVAACAAD